MRAVETGRGLVALCLAALGGTLALAALAGCGGDDDERAASGTGTGTVQRSEPTRRGGTRAARIAAGCTRPYADASPWNRPIGAARGRPAGLDQRLTSDPTQYTYPVYEVDDDTPLRTVRYADWYSRVEDGGRRTVNVRGGLDSGRVARVPIPSQARAADGSDAQAILLNRSTGEEWDLSRFYPGPDGAYDVVNVGRYHTDYDAVPPPDAAGKPWFLRGAKIPYLAGLVRPCEVARGRIDHALAFAYSRPTTRWVYPATSSDGGAPDGAGLPMGTRLQLDPEIGERTIRSWGCEGPCLTIARALQRYGMYLIDGAGRSKIMVEYESTARWNGTVTSTTPSPIPADRFLVVPPPPRG